MIVIINEKSSHRSRQYNFDIILNILCYNEKIYLDAGIDAPIDIIVRKEPKTRRGFNLTASAKRALSSITSRREKKEHGLKPNESLKQKITFLKVYILDKK